MNSRIRRSFVRHARRRNAQAKFLQVSHLRRYAQRWLRLNHQTLAGGAD